MKFNKALKDDNQSMRSRNQLQQQKVSSPRDYEGHDEHAATTPSPDLNIVPSPCSMNDDEKSAYRERLHMNQKLIAQHFHFATSESAVNTITNNNDDEHGGEGNVAISSHISRITSEDFTRNTSFLKKRERTSMDSGNQGESQQQRPGVEFIRSLVPGFGLDSALIRQARSTENNRQDGHREHLTTQQFDNNSAITDSGLSVATAVVLEQPVTRPSGKKWYRGVKAVTIGGILLVVVAVVLGVAFGVTGGKKANHTSEGPTPAKVTTSFDAFTLNCSVLSSQANPHVITQCHCNGTISKLAPDIAARYDLLMETFVSRVEPNFSFYLESCSPQNQALVWLASGDGLEDGVTEDFSSLRQRYGMALLFVVWNGISWNVNAEWLSSASECTWFGVKCANSEEIVTDIVLSSNKVVGQIPVNVSLFVNLTNLALDGNDLHNSTIPSEIGLLTKLQNLVLSSTSISGTIPAELYNGLGDALEIFQIDNNRMTGTLSTLIGKLFQIGK